MHNRHCWFWDQLTKASKNTPWLTFNTFHHPPRLFNRDNLFLLGSVFSVLNHNYPLLQGKCKFPNTKNVSQNRHLSMCISLLPHLYFGIRIFPYFFTLAIKCVPDKLLSVSPFCNLSSWFHRILTLTTFILSCVSTQSTVPLNYTVAPVLRM